MPPELLVVVILSAVYWVFKIVLVLGAVAFVIKALRR